MKILLRNTQPLLGDRLMFTPAVRDLKASFPDFQIGIVSAGTDIWDNNPYIDPSVTAHNADYIYDIGPAKVTKGSKTNGIHIVRAFTECLSEKMNTVIKHGPLKPDIHLSETEKKVSPVSGRYWVINIDTGPMSAKRWPFERFQQLVDSMPDITFVQVGLARDNKYRLRGNNIIDLVDRTKIRELFSLVYNAEGCISLVSSLMHVAAAFDKPCVVIAGGREPVTFEHYPFHRFLHTIGCVPCAKLQACWKNSIEACLDSDGTTAKCMDIIPVSIVKEAIESYYNGGMISNPPWQINIISGTRLKRIIKIVTNAKCLGGAERSVIEIAKLFVKNGWLVEICPSGHVCPEFEKALPVEVYVTNHLSRHCDILLLYASDMVFNFDKVQFDVFNNIPAKRKVMALTYKIGKTCETKLSRDWDKYIFLSTTLQKQFVDKISNFKSEISDTAVLAPCVNLEPFLKQSQISDFKSQINIVRHSSQGDSKFSKSMIEIINKCPDIKFSFMPGPSWLVTGNRVQSIEYSNKPENVAEFLASGNLFWYLLPDGYTDQGPRVIVEAMAAGLPVIAENRDGAADRVTPETGWLVNSHDEVAELINKISLRPEIIEQKSKAARQRAIDEFQKERWYEEIIK